MAPTLVAQERDKVVSFSERLSNRHLAQPDFQTRLIDAVRNEDVTGAMEEVL